MVINVYHLRDLIRRMVMIRCGDVKVAPYAIDGYQYLFLPSASGFRRLMMIVVMGMITIMMVM